MPRRFDELTWREVADLDADRTVALLPVGAIEAHGPHLPLATDLVIAEAMARAAAERLEMDGGLDVLLLPTLPYGAAKFAAGFAGTLDAPGEAIRSLITAVGQGLAGRVACLGIANAHLDPAHLTSVHRGVEALAGVLPVGFPDLTRRELAERLGEEFRSGACHAGRFETSIVLSARPDLVHDELRGRLPSHPVSLSQAIRAGQRSFEEAGLADAYCGDPAAASAEEGTEILEILGEALYQEVVGALELIRTGRSSLAQRPGGGGDGDGP